jgi:predicted DNA-binding protein YlxM (UPF0122 family)
MAVPGKMQDANRLVKTVRIGQLFELYGSLLTERQQEFVRLHHDEDMSFGEIAKHFGISRQAVHDAVQQAAAAMESYEAGLGLLAGQSLQPAAVAGGPEGESAAEAPAGAMGDVIKQIEHLRDRLSSQGIIYDPADFVIGLDEVIARLRRLQP